MIELYTGDFLVSPIPLQLSLNWCSHACSFCFANANRPGRRVDTKKLQSQIRNFPNQNNLVAHLLKTGHPVLISNLVDPFATSNYQIAVPVIEQLTALGVPVTIQTRGGKGIDDVLEFLPPSVWYMSITSLDDEVRRKLEPAAPDIPSRLKLAEKLMSAGHKVVVGPNPIDWLEDFDGYIKAMNERGIHHFWMAGLHLNAEQQRNLKPWQAEAIGPDMLQHAKIRGMSDRERDMFTRFEATAKSADDRNRTFGYEITAANDFFDIYRGTYPKTWPVLSEFGTWVRKNKGERGDVYFKEFADLFEPQFPEGEWHMPGYLYNMDRNAYKNNPGLKKKMTFRELLGYAWNEPLMRKCMDNFQDFAPLVKDTGGGVFDYVVDNDGNVVYHFNASLIESEYVAHV